MADDEVRTILDHVDNIAVPGDVFREPTNEYWALVCLVEGMSFLYAQVLRCENTARERINSGGVKVFSFPEDVQLNADSLHIGGRLPEGLNDIPVALLTSAFQWYAISACQYVKLVAAIAKKHDDSRPLPDDYAKVVIPEVLAYRNKVAAHYAWSSENKRDNNAERLASVLPQLSLSRGRFRTASMTVTLRQSRVVSNSGSIKEWSLTEVHEQLLLRYGGPEATARDSGSETSAAASLSSESPSLR